VTKRRPATPVDVLRYAIEAQQDFYCGESHGVRPGLAVWLARERLPRCGLDGHRMTYGGLIPVATRRRPWRAWRELSARREARRLYAARGAGSVL